MNKETCVALMGLRQNGVWIGTETAWSIGTPTEVEFDHSKVLTHEEFCGNIIGFFHTHPNATAKPSNRDVQTMHAWVNCLGKPLLCLIEGTNGLKGWVFEVGGGKPVKLKTAINHTNRTIFIGVEHEKAKRKSNRRKRTVAKC